METKKVSYSTMSTPSKYGRKMGLEKSTSGNNYSNTGIKQQLMLKLGKI